MKKKAAIAGLGLLALLGAVGLVLRPSGNRPHAKAWKDWKDRAIAEIARRAADTNWLVIETGTLKKRVALEPHPLTPSLSPTGGEGARRAGEGEAPRFKAGEQVRKEQGTAHDRAAAAAWFTHRLILMTNGQWIVYASKCSKEDPRIHDILIGRGSDGKWYYNVVVKTPKFGRLLHQPLLRAYAESLLAKLCAAVNTLPIGMPWDKEVKLTPLPEFDKAKSMKAYVDDAVAKGGRVINTGGGATCETLYFPAVVYPVAPNADLYNQEQFGPVVPVCSYRDEREFLEFVTRSNFGQQVSLFGRDHERLARLIDPLANQVCRINLNTQCQRGPDTLPFTGRKDSAEATLSISNALRCFSIRSLVAAQGNPESRQIIQQIVAGRHSSFLHTDFIL